MTTRLKNNRKKRGHISACHGRIGKHKKHPGGCGNAGGMHHHRILFDKYHPRYFWKVGMCYFHKTMNKFHCPIVNVDHLFLLMSDSTKFALERKGPLLDVTPFGYFKVLGKGNAPPTPLVIKENFFSKIAEKKIKEAGGQIFPSINV
ncbi:hypothetical protein GOP47_0022821 [Adiantum capillus-veneris]|uniref:Large ribosomal subunit protein uL15/eL18 domain-containing protein n=1 Tax=Adiantum capillus-veneris TaxID=13818 RepID=A0A9D4U6J6_ADICA|nr:hypothetical protein GOP47_0022821 [Adiantum capillus-veneris]